MAIYRKGQASMDAQGVITGYDTKWQDKLSLIRSGATIFFIGQSLQAAVINEVISDTQISATSTNGVVVPRGDYVILLHDSITVDGLAQDIAETLRYYQGKETEFAHLIELIESMDIEEIRKVVEDMKAEVIKFDENFKKIEAKAAEVESNRQAVADDRAAIESIHVRVDELAEQSKASADRSFQQYELAKAEVVKAHDEANTAQRFANNAAEEVTKAAGEVEKAKQVVETAKQEVVIAANEQAERAKEQADRAKNEADRAEDLANQFDSTKALVKSKNLSDLTDVAAARKNLGVDSIEHNDVETKLLSKDKTVWLSLRNIVGKPWGVYDGGIKKWVPLGIAQGGTGANDLPTARAMMKIDRVIQDENMTRIKSSDNKTEMRIGFDDWYVYRDSQDSEAGYIPLGVKGGGTGGTNATEARYNLGLEIVEKKGSYTMIHSPNQNNRLALGDDGIFVWQDKNGTTIPMAINSGGTGAMTVDGARNNLGVGKLQTPQFASLDLTVPGVGDTNGGILRLNKSDDGGAITSQSRMYHELQGGVAKTVIHTANNTANKHNYLQIDEDGNVTGAKNVTATGTLNCGSIDSVGDILARQAKRVGVSTQAGGNKDIFLQNISGDGNVNGWVNLLQGNWHSGYWQLGAVRGTGANIDHVKLGFNNGAGIWREWAFGYDGSVKSQKYIAYNATGAGEGAAAFKLDGTATDGGGCIVGGKVGGWADWSAWRGRPAGLIAEFPTNEVCINVWKAVQWGRDWISAMDVYNPNSGSFTTALHVGNADFYFNSDNTAMCGQWVSTSDIRMKANLKKIGDATDKLKSIVGYTYYKRNELEESEKTVYTVEAGVIAQDVQTVLPESVMEITTQSERDIKGVNYNGVTALLVNGFNEMRERVEKQEEEIENLKAVIAEMQSLMSKAINK